MKNIRKLLTAQENDQLQSEIYVTVEKDGDNAFRCTFDEVGDAVDAGDHAGQIVATYKLVKIEKLRLVRTVSIIKAKL